LEGGFLLKIVSSSEGSQGRSFEKAVEPELLVLGGKNAMRGEK